MDIQKEKLPNQLKTLFIDQKGAQCGTVQIWFRAGSSLEEKGNEGIAHFLEHMFFKGTEQRPGSKIADEVESFGGELNAFTSFDYTCYYINFPNSKIKQSIHILLDMVSHPQFLEKELIPERGVVFEEYRRSLDHPSHDNFHQIQKTCFSKGYAHPILGFQETIKKFSRHQLTKFRSSYYNLSNSMLIVSGDLKEKEQIKEIIAQYKLPHGPQSQFSDFKLQKNPKISLQQKDVQMIQTTLSIQAPCYEEKQGPQEDLAINSLGYGESSPLYQNLVAQNSLANAASGSTMFMAKGGAHFIRLICPPQNLGKVYREFIKVLKTSLTKGISDENIEKIKNQYIASRIYEKESLESFSFSLGHGFAQNGDIHSEEKFINELKECSATQAHQSLIRLFKRPVHINIQVPRETKTHHVKKEALFLQSRLKSLGKMSDPSMSIPKVKVSAFDPHAQLIKLKKGITLIHRYHPLTPTFNMYAFIKGGLTEETKQTNGLYNMLGHLLVKGYKGKNDNDLKLELDTMSSSLNGFTGKNSYGLSTHGLTQYARPLFDIFFNSLIHPLFLAKSFQHEKKMAKRELLNQQEDPAKQCFQLVNQILFPGHPYGLPTLGSSESLKKIQRKAIIETHKKNIKSKEIVLSFSGAIELEKVLSLIAPALKQLPSRTEQKNPIKKISSIKKYHHHRTFKREQTHIFIGVRGFPHRHKSNLLLKMLTTHLAGQSSELFMSVRDQKGLCYVVQPLHFSALEGGYWGIYMASGAEKTPTAIQAIQEILDHYQKQGLTREEFERVKLMIQGQDLLNIQTNDDYAQIYSVPILQGLGWDYHHKALQSIQNSTLKDFNKAIRSLLSQKRVQVTVGTDYELSSPKTPLRS